MQLKQRSGLATTTAALLATLAMGYSQFIYERASRAQLPHALGIGLVYLPGGMHWVQLYSAAVHECFRAPRKRGLANVDLMVTTIA